MGGLLFNVTTAALMVMMINSGLAVVGRDSLRERPVPWVAVGLTVLAVAGVVLQLCWAGAMAALDDDPAKTGWWRVFTSVFMQNGGVAGAIWNIATLAFVAALGQWLWGGSLTALLFLVGILLPERIDALLGLGGGPSADPRNFAGSSGATYFLGASLAAALLARTRIKKEQALAVGVPALGLLMWCAQDNGHGLVAVYGFGLGTLVWAVLRWMPRPGTPVRRRGGPAAHAKPRAHPPSNALPPRSIRCGAHSAHWPAAPAGSSRPVRAALAAVASAAPAVLALPCFAAHRAAPARVGHCAVGRFVRGRARTYDSGQAECRYGRPGPAYRAKRSPDVK